MTKSLFRNKFLIATAALLSAALMITAVAGFTGAVPSKAADEKETKRTINTTGTGKISVSPDIAYINLGVVTEDKVAKTAQQSNAASMSKVVAQIKGAGIASDDIKTIDYSLEPKYDYNKQTGESKIIGYRCTNTVQVTIRDITKVGTIIDLAGSSSGNITNSISFGLSDYEKSYNEALKKAMEAAKKRAETMASAIGITLKTPVTVTESGGSAPIYNYRTYDLVKAEAAAPQTTIQSGMIEVSANVSMVYEY